jgi:hypothetical protein
VAVKVEEEENSEVQSVAVKGEEPQVTVEDNEPVDNYSGWTDGVSRSHLTQWRRDLVAHEEPIDATAKRELILVLKRWVPAGEFDRAHSLVHGVCVPSCNTVIRSLNNGGNLATSARNKRKRLDGSEDDILPAAAIKKRCMTQFQAPLVDTTWGADKEQMSETTLGTTGAVVRKTPIDNSTWGKPVPKVTQEEPSWVRIVLPANHNITSQAQQQPNYSNGNRYHQNAHPPRPCDSRYVSRRSPPHQEYGTHHSCERENTLHHHHHHHYTQDHNQHQHHSPQRNRDFQRHQNCNYKNKHY